MDWKNDVEKRPLARAQASVGPVDVAVSEVAGDGRTWKWLAMSFGQFSDLSMEACKATWPREAIELARKALDAFEATLDAHPGPTLDEIVADNNATNLAHVMPPRIHPEGCSCGDPNCPQHVYR